jgi:hypothetical protein
MKELVDLYILVPCFGLCCAHGLDISREGILIIEIATEPDVLDWIGQ